MSKYETHRALFFLKEFGVAKKCSREQLVPEPLEAGLMWIK